MSDGETHEGAFGDEKAAAEALLALYAAVDGESFCWERIVRLLVSQQEALAKRDAAAVLEVCRLLRTAADELGAKQRHRGDAVAAYARLAGVPSDECSLARLAVRTGNGAASPDAERWQELRRRLARLIRAAQVRSAVNQELLQDEKALNEAIIDVLIGVPELPTVDAATGEVRPAPRAPALLDSSA